MQNVRISSGRVTVILGEEITDSANQITGYLGVDEDTVGEREYKDSPTSSYTAVVIGTGAVSASVDIEASNDGVYWNETPLGTIALTGTDSSVDGFATNGASYKYVRAVLSGLTGTGATCYVLQGV